MKNTWKFLLVLAAAAVPGLSLHANAQTVENGIGSSAMFLQLGEAANQLITTAGGTPACVWTNGTGVFSTDTQVSPSAVDTGNAWLAWSPASAGVCTGMTAAVNTSVPVYGYLQTDSVVGDRCLFNAANHSSCKLTNNGGATANLLHNADSSITEIGGGTGSLPAALITLMNGRAPNYSGTDIRPEDAKFAITRALASCGTPITQFSGPAGNNTQYLGLGYKAGGATNNTIVGFSSGSFFVVPFDFPASGFAVTPLGATPIVVAVHGTVTPAPSAAGFSDSRITNLNRSTLALYLDGSIGTTAAALPPGDTTTSAAATTVWLREPLSGTYNTTEYNIPNNVELQTSQDVGVNQLTITASPSNFNQNCDGAGNPEWNLAAHAMGVVTSSGTSTTVAPFRKRAIGTGSELSNVIGSGDSLGYAFWSASNFAAFTAASNSRYVTVDGVDPLFTSYTNGTIPTTAAQLATVNLAGVATGNYPIWSLLRLVTVGSSAPTEVTNLATTSQQFVTASHPDFVPFDNSGYVTIPNLAVERAHFTPPGIAVSGAIVPQNGTCGLARGAVENGGDVGGVVISCQVDADFLADTGATFSGTTIPSSSRRQ